MLAKKAKVGFQVDQGDDAIGQEEEDNVGQHEEGAVGQQEEGAVGQGKQTTRFQLFGTHFNSAQVLKIQYLPVPIY